MRWNLGLLVLGLAAGTQPILGPRARNAATLVDRRKLPLHTRGRYIVNTDNERVKWACINWAGEVLFRGPDAESKTKKRRVVTMGQELQKGASTSLGISIWLKHWPGGAYSLPGVVGGLEVQNLTNLAARISILGFNCVRLCYSTENHLLNPLVKEGDPSLVEFELNEVLGEGSSVGRH
eukprot:g603.t1